MYNLTIIINIVIVVIQFYIMLYFIICDYTYFLFKKRCKNYPFNSFSIVFFLYMEIEKLQKKTNMAIIYIYLYYIQTFSRGNYYNLIISFAFYTIINT